MAPTQSVGLLESAIHVRAENACGRAPANLLALPAKPLSLRNERYTITLLMDCKITPIAKNDGVSILAISVVADRAFAIWLVAGRIWITIDSRL